MEYEQKGCICIQAEALKSITRSNHHSFTSVIRLVCPEQDCALSLGSGMEKGRSRAELTQEAQGEEPGGICVTYTRATVGLLVTTAT